MKYDMPFYEADNRQILKQHGGMDQHQNGNGDDTSVSAMLHDWKEENLDIESLLSNSKPDSQSGNQSPYQSDHQVPTFNSNGGSHASGIARPNALDLTRAVKYEQGSCQQMSNHTPVSPHRSPYHNGAEVGTPYSYGNTSPSSSNSRQTTPTSPYTRALHSPVSPHQVSPVSPHQGVVVPPPLSPHHQQQQGSCSRASSCSPVPPYMPAVFGRYASDGMLEDSYSPYGAKPGAFGDYKGQHGSVDKNSDVYRAKRERNNIAVRRSREKKKQREAENEMRVQELTDENTKLQMRLDVVLKEMKLLKSLYKNIGVALPSEAQRKIEQELAKINSDN